MKTARAWLRAAAAYGLALAAGCASSGGNAAAPACPGFTPPAPLSLRAIALPQTYASAGLAADVFDEIVVARDGAVASIRLVATSVPPLAPFAEASLQRSKFAPGKIEGNPVAVRGWIKMHVGGIVQPGRKEPPYDSLRAFVPGGASREAQWQLAGSVDRLEVVAHVGSAAPSGVAVVAVASGGAEQTLLTVPTAAPIEIRETVKTRGFLHEPGDYRLELRSGAKTLAATTFTVATGFETAIVNACEPLVGPEKTGPGH